MPKPVRAPDMPTDETAVPPPGIGISDATVPKKMERASSVQNERVASKASRQASRQKPYSTLVPIDPTTRKNTWRGERRAAPIVPHARVIEGITALRSRG